MVRFLFKEELDNLFKVLQENNLKYYVIFKFSYRHGLRASEVGLITLKDLDFNTHRVYIKRLKNGVSSLHPLPDDEISMLQEYIKSYSPKDILFYGKYENVPVSRKTLDRIMKIYGGRIGIHPDKLHFHILRHSLGVHLIQAGVHIRVVQSILGHRNIQNTLIYTQIADTYRDKEYLRAIKESGEII